MTIKTFKEWYGSGYESEQLADYTHDAYNAGVKAASDHFEEEKVKIHEYYDMRIKELMGGEHKEPVTENSGKLT